MKKAYFPHLFNTDENQDYVGSLPAQLSTQRHVRQEPQRIPTLAPRNDPK